MAIIKIDELSVMTIIGINDDERINKQEVLINYKLEVDISKAAESDDINDCVNYRTVNKEVADFVADSSFFTVEKLLAKILEILISYDGVKNAEATVSKPGALRYTSNVSLTDKISK